MKNKAHEFPARALRAVIASLFVVATASNSHAATVRDATGANVEVSDVSRIVSIGGSITEILYALKVDQKVVAVDQTSLFPPAARSKADVGYMRALSAEGVLGVNPSVIISQEGSGPKEVVAILAAAKVPMVVVPDRYTGQGVIDKIKLVAAAVGETERGECLVRAVSRNLAELADLRSKLKDPPRIMFVLSFRDGRALVSGRGTAADGMIALSGGRNAVEEYEGYKQINDEAIIAANPDVILAMTREGNGVTADTVFAQTAFSMTNAAKRRAFVSMDGLYLLGFGPRTADAARDLAAKMFPEVVRPAEVSSIDCSK